MVICTHLQITYKSSHVRTCRQIAYKSSYVHTLQTNSLERNMHTHTHMQINTDSWPHSSIVRSLLSSVTAHPLPANLIVEQTSLHVNSQTVKIWYLCYFILWLYISGLCGCSSQANGLLIQLFKYMNLAPLDGLEEEDLCCPLIRSAWRCSSPHHWFSPALFCLHLWAPLICCQIWLLL